MLIFEDFSLNIEVFRFINSHYNRTLDLFFLYFSYLGSGWILIPIVLYLIKKRDWSGLKLLALSIAVESLIVWFFKKTFTQPRPAKLLEDVHLLIPLYNGSFPSGDTAMAFVIATSFFYKSRAHVKLLLIAYAVTIAYGRVYLGVHFPLDVFSGAIIGILSVVLVKKVTG